MSHIRDIAASTSTHDPKPPSPSDPANEPPIEEPDEASPEREEPGQGGDGTNPADLPMIAV